MKFLALKQALEQLEVVRKNYEEASVTLSKPFCFTPRRKAQTTVGGEVLFKPIDRTSALVVSKAPWWAVLITTTPTHKNHEPFIRENRKIQEGPTTIRKLSGKTTKSKKRASAQNASSKYESPTTQANVNGKNFDPAAASSAGLLSRQNVAERFGMI